MDCSCGLGLVLVGTALFGVGVNFPAQSWSLLLAWSWHITKTSLAWSWRAAVGTAAICGLRSEHMVILLKDGWPSSDNSSSKEHLFFNGCAYTLGLPISAKLRGDGSQCFRAKLKEHQCTHPPASLLMLLWVSDESCVPETPCCLHLVVISSALAVSSGLRRDLNCLPRSEPG